MQNGPIAMNDEEQSTWSAAQKKSAQLNQRVMLVLQSAMNLDEADQVENCSTSMEIWRALESTYEEPEENEIDSSSINEDYKWYLDSGCFHHMSGKKSLFSFLTLVSGGKVWFGDNGCGVIGFGTVGEKTMSSFKNVLFVE
ncbi:unnamed protein product, partial [Linum tenue]